MFKRLKLVELKLKKRGIFCGIGHFSCFQSLFFHIVGILWNEETVENSKISTEGESLKYYVFKGFFEI